MKKDTLAQSPFVLVVSDVHSRREFIRTALDAVQADRWMGADTEKAYELVRSRRPALVIVDSAPGGAGEEFVRMLRSPANPRYGDLPVLRVSGAGPENLPGAFDAESGAGCEDAWMLPLHLPALTERVRTLLGGVSAVAPWRVLLVLPAGDELDGLRASFAAYDTELGHASREEEVEAALAGGTWDTVIWDLDLPGLDRRRLSACTAKATDTTFVAVTSDAAPSGSVASLRAGADAHLRRPFASDYLVGLSHLAWQKVALVRARRMLERRTVELRRSEGLLQGVLDSSDQIFLVVDDAGRIELFNEAAHRRHASVLRAAPARGVALSDLLPEELHEALADGLARALAGDVFQRDADFVDRDGRRRRFIIRYAPLRADGAPRRRICLNAYDISDRAQAEDQLRLRNHALSSVSQGVIITDAERRILYVNAGFTRITGYAPEEAVGRGIRFLHGPDTPFDLADRARRTLGAGLGFETETINYRKDGTPFWNDLTVTPVKNERGEITQFVGVQRDVTERRRQQNALAASQARLRALFDHSKDAILFAADDGAFVDGNPAARVLLGYGIEELRDQRFARLFSPEDRETAEGVWRDFLASGRYSGELGLRRHDGTPVRVEINAVARIQPGIHLAILRDVTTRDALQSHLMRQQRLESIGRLASGVAHDLNNILTPILMAPAILRPHLTEPGARTLLDSIASGARRGSFIVRQLMTFARADAGAKVPLDLRDVVDDVGSIIRETFRKEISLELVPLAVGARFPLLGDSSQLRQAVLNLALNAADSMPRGGRLIVALDRVELSADDLAAEAGAAPGAFARVSVVDHGAGIASENMDRIFDPFFTTKPFGKGSGLGLSVVLGIARGHGGFARISSRPGVGTIARMFIPLRPADVPAPPQAGAPSPVLGLAGRVVLVVDDEAPVRDVVRNILAWAGCEVLCAADVEAAFSQIQAAGPRLHLVVTDLAMPLVSGVTFIEVLRSRRPDLPILVLTGADTRDNLPESVRPHVKGVLGKPCDANTLLSAAVQAIRLSPEKASP